MTKYLPYIAVAGVALVGYLAWSRQKAEDKPTSVTYQTTIVEDPQSTAERFLGNLGSGLGEGLASIGQSLMGA